MPPGNSARQAYEEVARTMGPGWPTPYNMIVATPGGCTSGKLTVKSNFVYYTGAPVTLTSASKCSK